MKKVKMMLYMTVVTLQLVFFAGLAYNTSVANYKYSDSAVKSQELMVEGKEDHGWH